MQNIMFLFLMIFLFVGCSQHKQNVSVVINDNKGQNIITSEGNKVLNESFDRVYTYSEDYVKIESKKKVGIASYEGEIMLNPIYETISTMYNGYGVIEYENKFGLINKEISVVLEPSLEEIQIRDDFFVAKKDGKVYCMNDDFELFSQPYEHIYYFIDGYARVEANEKFGFINKSCEEVLDVQYDYASDFLNGFAKLELDNKYLYINQDMNIITEEAYKDTYFFKGK